MGIFKWYKLRNDRNLIQKEIDQLIFKQDKLNTELGRLINDKEYIKQLAQEKFHMVKKGEKVFRVVNKNSE
tara:strand:+ start:4925 stop:5137 length:213 start_codon:yes stop_codon:yes gene_type:complete